MRARRQSLRRSFLRAEINAFAVFVFPILALFAFVAGQPFSAVALLVLLAAILLSPILIKFENYQLNRKVEFWKWVRKRGLSGEPPTGDTRLLIDKIVQIQTATPDELLPMRQAVKLVDAYERQTRQLQTINARLAQIGATRLALSEKTQQLQALGENHAAGLQSLERTRADFEALQKVAREVQSSCERLKAILDTARKTAVTRQLHRELDQLSAAATPEGNAAFDAESNDAIERQIGHEIETYLRLERETEEQLR